MLEQEILEADWLADWILNMNGNRNRVVGLSLAGSPSCHSTELM